LATSANSSPVISKCAWVDLRSFPSYRTRLTSSVLINRS
jgi:hypothetical protein